MKTVISRKSIRNFAERPVDSTLLNTLLDASARTQTMGNLQLYSVVITQDEKNKQKLSPLHFNQPMVVQAPVLLTVCADFNRTVKWAEYRKAHPGYDNFLSFMNAVSDALLYTQTFCNLAEAEGLGICYLGTTLYSSSQIIEILKLPRLVFPIATLAVGWPAENPNQTDRLPLSAIIHNEVYHDYTESTIDDLYNYKENLPENKRFIEINNKETLAQIFTDIRYSKNDNEMISGTLIEALKQQGFL